MSQGLQILLWGLAAMTPLALAIATRRKADAVGLAGMLLATWVFGRFMGVLFTVPESMSLYPVVDWLCGMIAFRAWQTQRETWKLVLSCVFVFQLSLHIPFWLAWELGHKGALRFYLPANNAMFALGLLVGSWGSLEHVASGLVGRFPVLARVLHSRRSSP